MQVSATAGLVVTAAVAVEVEVQVAEVDTADMHPSAAVAFDSQSSTELGLSVPAAPAELRAVLLTTAAALPAAAAFAGADATLTTITDGAELHVVSAATAAGKAAAVAVAGVSSAPRSAVPADTPVATDDVSADADSAAQKSEAAMLSGPVIVEQAAASEDANARMAAELAAIFARVGNELLDAPSEHSEVPSDPSQTPVEPSVTHTELPEIFTENKPEVDDAQPFSAGGDQNACMAAELAAIFALAGPPPQQSLVEPFSEASAAADSVVADSVAANDIVAFSVIADSVIADSVVSHSVVANSAATSLPLQDASTADVEATRSDFDTQSAEYCPAEQSSLTAPVTSAEDFPPTESAVGVQFIPASEDVSAIHDSCPGMDVSSEANAPCTTEQHILTAAAFAQTLQTPCGIELIRQAGDCTAAGTVGKGIARAYSHDNAAGEEFSPMVLLGTPELTLPGM